MELQCSIPDCGRPARKRGWCETHYSLWRKHADPSDRLRVRRQPQPLPRLCSIEGCERRHVARGFCSLHYERLMNHGDPFTVLPPHRPTGPHPRPFEESSAALAVLFGDRLEYARIPLHHRDGAVRDYTMIDTADVSLLGPHRWSMSNGYVIHLARENGRKYPIFLHRIIMGLPSQLIDPHEVDHINRNGLDNRRQNLRILTSAGNAQNVSKRRGPTSSRFRGVSFARKRNNWMAYLRIDGKMLNLGSFATEEEAAEVVRRARAELMPFAVD